MSTHGGGGQRQRSAGGAAYNLKTGLPQDLADVRPPFSMEQFAAATLRPVESSGYNRSYQATLNGQRYLVKEMREDASPTEAAYARHSAYADAIGSRVAHLVGLGDLVVPTYAFDHNGRHYVAARYLSGVRSVDEVQAAQHLTDEQLARATLFEYVLHTENPGTNRNYLVRDGEGGKSGQTWLSDFGEAFMRNDARSTTSLSLELYRRSQERGADRNGARFSAADVQRLLSAEPEITRLLRANGLESGIPGLQARMGVLRAMMASGNLTQQGLSDQVNAWITANTTVPGTTLTPPAPAASPARGGGFLNRFRRGG